LAEAQLTLRLIEPMPATVLSPWHERSSRKAIEHGARMLPPLESDSWPICRPIVEWMLPPEA
jgi:hypothetical protein